MLLKGRYFAGYYSFFNTVKFFPKNEKNSAFCFGWGL